MEKLKKYLNNKYPEFEILDNIITYNNFKGIITKKINDNMYIIDCRYRIFDHTIKEEIYLGLDSKGHYISNPNYNDLFEFNIDEDISYEDIDSFILNFLQYSKFEINLCIDNNLENKLEIKLVTNDIFDKFTPNIEFIKDEINRYRMSENNLKKEFLEIIKNFCKKFEFKNINFNEDKTKCKIEKDGSYLNFEVGHIYAHSLSIKLKVTDNIFINYLWNIDGYNFADMRSESDIEEALKITIFDNRIYLKNENNIPINDGFIKLCDKLNIKSIKIVKCKSKKGFKEIIFEKDESK